MKAIEILLVDDHPIFRDGIRGLLEKDPMLKVIGEADDGRAALELLETLHPDLILMDITMPNLNGVDTARLIRAKNQDARILILSMNSDPHFVKDAFAAGVNGYMLKGDSSKEMTRAMKTVMAGKIYLSPGITGISVETLANGAESEPLLSVREREILQLITEGNSIKAIAYDLKLSRKTVEAYRKKIMAKLKVESVAELTKYAIREGLTSL